MKQRGKVLILILANLASLIVVLVVAELITRQVWTPPSTLSVQVTEQHPVYGWAPIPGLTGRTATIEYDYEFSHSRQGLRANKLYTSSRPTDTKRRVLFLGDSFTYGVGVGDDAGFIGLLNQQYGDTEFINTGANGYGQRQQLAILQTLGAKLQPDVTVVMFFWNDLEDNLNPEAATFELDDAGQVVRTDRVVPADFDPLALRDAAPPSHGKNDSRIWRRTWLYKLFKEGARGFRHRWFGGRPRTIRNAEQAALAWRTTESLLELMRIQSAAIGTQLIVVSIPDYDRVDARYQLKSQLPVNVEIEHELAEVCARLGITYVDLLPDLIAASSISTEPLYYATDRHLTPAGHMAVAKLLAGQLLSAQ
jgi:lysophospholipase L1-like esterase